MTVYLVEFEHCYGDHWVEKVFDSRQKADEYCIKSGCSQRMSEDIDTDWENPKDPLDRCHVIQMDVE